MTSYWPIYSNQSFWDSSQNSVKYDSFKPSKAQDAGMKKFQQYFYKFITLSCSDFRCLLKKWALIFLSFWSSHLNNYFNFHICLSFRPSICASVHKLVPILAVVSLTVTNKSCLVCVMSEKYECWVNLRPQWDRCSQGEAEVRILDFETTWSESQKLSLISKSLSDCCHARRSRAAYIQS